MRSAIMRLSVSSTVLAAAIALTVVACGGGGDGGPTGGGTWPVPDLAGMTQAPSVSAQTFAVAAPAGGAQAGSSVELSNARTGATSTSTASDVGAFVGGLEARPGDTLEVRLNYDGRDTEPATVTLPAATDRITISNVLARRNRDGGETGVTGRFTTTLGHRPTVRVFTKTGTARVSDSAVEGNPNLFEVRLDAAVGETVIVHAFDGDDPLITTEYVEIVVTP